MAISETEYLSPQNGVSGPSCFYYWSLQRHEQYIIKLSQNTVIIATPGTNKRLESLGGAPAAQSVSAIAEQNDPGASHQRGKAQLMLASSRAIRGKVSRSLCMVVSVPPGFQQQ